ncbi:MAG: hypothetical protein J6R59_12170 [Paludibacteraceae bacterium]|jgi:hypothetical protein|nr:hypothetical protein [Paludibacteraceae bacterium]
MKNKLLLLAFLLGLPLLAIAQSVSYTYKPLAAEGCYVSYSVAQQDSSYYIVVTIRSDRFKFLSESTMLIRTFKDDVIKLEGKHIDSSTESVGIVSGNIVIPVTELNTTAMFSITSEQIEKLNDGVAKIRITAIPMNHERTFKKDKIGKKLYEFLHKLFPKNDNF